MEMVWKRKSDCEDLYVKRRQEYQQRWDVYRQQQEQLRGRKKQIMERLVKQCFFETAIKLREVLGLMSDQLRLRRFQRDFELKKDFTQRMVKRFFMRFHQKLGPT
jgi:hypothetical protein